MQDRPSLPYQQSQRPPTGPQRSTQEESPLHPPTFSAEDWFAMMRKFADEAVIRTRNDEKLRRDVTVAQDQSRTIMALSSSLRRFKIYLGLMVGISTGVGAAAATVMNAYQSARLDAVEPAARAEAKAERADKKAEVIAATVEERLEEFEERHIATEAILANVSETLKANTKAINQLDSKLDDLVQTREKRSR